MFLSNTPTEADQESIIHTNRNIAKYIFRLIEKAKMTMNSVSGPRVPGLDVIKQTLVHGIYRHGLGRISKCMIDCGTPLEAHFWYIPHTIYVGRFI